MKIFIKSVVVLIVVLILLASSLATFFFYYYRDDIIKQFVDKANDHINTPVRVGSIDITFFDHFPSVGVKVENVVIEDSHEGEHPLAVIGSMSFSINIFDAWQGQYIVKGFHVRDGQLDIIINEQGEHNYQIYKAKDTLSGEQDVAFQLQNAVLKNITFNYTDQQKKWQFLGTIEKQSLLVVNDENKVEFALNGKLHMDKVHLENNQFLVDKPVSTQLRFIYHKIEDKFTVNTSALQVGNAPFVFKGTFLRQPEVFVDFLLLGQQTTWQTLLSFFPVRMTRPLQQYQGKGKIHFEARLTGKVSENEKPALRVQFGFQETTLIHPSTGLKIEQARVKGKFTIPALDDLSKAELQLQNVSGQIDGYAFQSDVLLKNLENPFIRFQFSGITQMQALHNIFNLTQYSNLSGELGIDLFIKGEIEKLKKKESVNEVQVSGKVTLKEGSFARTDNRLKGTKWKGELEFNNNDILIRKVSGNLGRSDFHLNGHIKNLIPYLLHTNQFIGVDLSLQSSFLDLDELLQSSGYFLHNQTIEDSIFHLSPKLYLQFKPFINTLTYKRFKASHFVGQLVFRDQMVIIPRAHLQTMGGALSFNSMLNGERRDRTEVDISCQLEDVDVDSLFYVFHNFNQDFIKDQHVRGKVFTKSMISLAFDKTGELIPESLEADIDMTIKNGELNQFEPLQALKKYIDQEELARLRFSDLTNKIQIKDKTIYIPQMEIRSNVTPIQLSGIHTFDQTIDYRFVVPLRKTSKIDPDEAFGSVERDDRGNPQLYLKIIGTTSQYEASLDKSAIKKKIVSDIKKEIKELKSAFHMRYKKQDSMVLDKNNYFDFEKNR